MNQERVGVIGLGLMGTAMTERLLELGYQVDVHNRTREKAKPLELLGARWSDNPIVSCDRILVSLYTSTTVNEVLERLGSALRPGQTIIDTTTGEPTQTIELARWLAERGVDYLDAPISGSSLQTRHGDVTMVVGGARSVFDACEKLLKSIANHRIYAGPSGSGSKMKLVSNLVLGLNRAALAEGLVFAKSIDVKPAAALEFLMQSMAYSKIMDTKGKKMVEGDFAVQAKLSQHLKDIQIILQLALQNQQRLPLTQAHSMLLERAEILGYGESDNSAIIQALHDLR